jgi:hypothetical protein
MKKIEVYIAGPYASDPRSNTVRAIEYGVALREAGPDIVPVIPHLFHFAQTVSPHDEAFWLAWDFDLLAGCDAIIRLPGESKGADAEVDRAVGLGLVVVVISDLAHAVPSPAFVQGLLDLVHGEES